VNEGLGALDEALTLVAQTGERFYEAELYRLQGQLIVASARSGAQAHAQSCFEKAIAVARAQGPKSLELRASTSLARCGTRRTRAKRLDRC